MSLSAKLELRQSQSLVMTPQLQQAIKMLQLSNLELTEFVEGELEKNPLLERDDDSPDDNSREASEASADDAPKVSETDAAISDAGDDGAPEQWLDLADNPAKPDPAEGLDTGMENVFPDAADGTNGPAPDSSWSSISSKQRPASGGESSIEAYVAEQISLADHLTAQLNLAVSDPTKRIIGQHLIDMVDEDGYVRGDLNALAERLGAPLALIEETLGVLHRV